MAYATNDRAFGTIRTGGFADFRANMSERWTRYKTYRATLTELQQLTDRDLADLGITRGSIRSIALEASQK